MSKLTSSISTLFDGNVQLTRFHGESNTTIDSYYLIQHQVNVD